MGWCTVSILMFNWSAVGVMPDVARHVPSGGHMASAGEHIRRQEGTWEIMGHVGGG